MGAPNRYPGPETPPRLEVARPAPRSKRTRLLVIAAIILALVVLVGIAIFIAGLGGGNPTPHTAPKAPTSMWVATG